MTSPGAQVLHRGPVDVVQQAFDQIARRRQILQPLLVLNADRVAAELIRDPHGGDIHLALLQRLRLGQLGLLIFAPA